MNANKKQELTQLLHEVLENLEIRISNSRDSRFPSPLPVDVYKEYLKDSWSTFSDSAPWIEGVYNVYITDDTTESKILDFLREVFASCIDDKDFIQSASTSIKGGLTKYPLDFLLKQLVKITIVQGVEVAVSAVDRCATDTRVSFQYMALLEGIRVEEEIQIFDGVRLVPLSDSTSELPHYLPSTFNSELSVSFMGKTVLIIDAAVSPIFSKGYPEEGFDKARLPFTSEVNSKKLLNFNEADFHEKICQALSLSCNSAVQISIAWRFLKADELCNLSFGGGGYSRYLSANVFRGHTVAGMSQVEEAKHIYDDLEKFNPNQRKKMLKTINRWIQSKTSQTDVDRMIDLGIAMESIYLSDNTTEQLTYQFRLRASLLLGRGKADRKKYMKRFEQIYKWRSRAVHSDELPRSPKDKTMFITEAQDYCRDSIFLILKNGEFPDWNDLILDKFPDWDDLTHG